ncbi:MAG TPA: alkaline phosphatase, partial [Isosphaeraceae bacterium]|nr:alkaline phosphatase [Isosphaeraceae bacterium]
QKATEKSVRNQGKNASTKGSVFLADDDRKAIDVARGGQYEVVETEAGVEGAKALKKAAEKAAKEGHKLFGFFGTNTNHLPFQTANGDFHPAKGVHGSAESYKDSDLTENPRLADMTRAALTVLAAKPGKPFALFVEAGDVDFGLHDNNLDNAIGALYSGEAAIQVITDWVEANSNWDESVLIVTSDHGHYLVLDHPKALSGAAKRAK